RFRRPYRQRREPTSWPSPPRCFRAEWSLSGAQATAGRCEELTVWLMRCDPPGVQRSTIQHQDPGLQAAQRLYLTDSGRRSTGAAHGRASSGLIQGGIGTEMKGVMLRSPGGLDRLELVEMPDPGDPGPGEIRVRIHASSLNYHDYAVAIGAIPTTDGRIP